MPSPSNPQTINRHPKSIVMDLHLGVREPAENVLPLSLSSLAAFQIEDKPRLQLGLTIDFRGYQPIAIPAGKELGLPNREVDFGFQRGQLQLFLENCKMPQISDFWSQGSGCSIAVDKPNPEQESIWLHQEHRNSVVDTLPKQTHASEDAKLEEIYVERQGSEESPIWMFKTQGKQKILEGKLTNVVLGTLPYLSMPYKLTARFTVRHKDIRLNWGKSVTTLQSPHNKLAIIQTMLIHEYIGPTICALPLCEVR